MPDATGRWPGDPENRAIKFKLIDTDPDTGEAVWAQIVALEPASIGGGGGGGLTDAQLRATPVPVSGTFWQATQPVSGPLTDMQLRASAVPVSGPLTDTQLRASAVSVRDNRDVGVQNVMVAWEEIAGTAAQVAFTWFTAANTCTVGLTFVGYLYTP